MNPIWEVLIHVKVGSLWGLPCELVFKGLRGVTTTWSFLCAVLQNKDNRVLHILEGFKTSFQCTWWAVTSCHLHGEKVPHRLLHQNKNSECCTRSGNQTEFKWKLVFLNYFAGKSIPATTQMIMVAPGNRWGGDGEKHPWQEEHKSAALQGSAGIMCSLKGWGGGRFCTV